MEDKEIKNIEEKTEIIDKTIEKQIQDEINKYSSLNEQLKETIEKYKEIIGEIKTKKIEIKTSKEIIENVMIDNNIIQYESGDYVLRLNIKKQKPMISEEIMQIFTNSMEKEMKNNKINEKKINDIIKSINNELSDTQTDEEKKSIQIKKKKVKDNSTKTKKITEKKKKVKNNQK
jgi:hypothetical protein